jgi:hypothetical protein
MGPYCWSLALPILLGAAQEELPAGWKMVAPKEGRFTVAMPAEPMKKEKQVKTATEPLTVVMHIADGRNDSLFVVSYSDFREADLKKGDVEKRLDQARDGAIASARGKQRSEEKIKLKGHPGREIAIEKDGEIVAKMRIYLVKNRLYQVMVLGNAPAKDVGIFLVSFDLNE